jgi:hypothetical protein
MVTPVRRLRVATCLIALSMLAAAAADADEQPATSPTRDVDVSYRVAGPDAATPAEQRVRWAAAAGLQRIDPPTPGLHIIIDTRTHHLASVRDKERVALEIDQTAAPPASGAGAGYTRLGTASVAGLDCTVWQASHAPGMPELCFTSDGVLLRVVANGNVLAEATRVTYAPANPADFQIPSDYRRIVPGPATSAPPPPTAPTTTPTPAPKESTP